MAQPTLAPATLATLGGVGTTRVLAVECRDQGRYMERRGSAEATAAAGGSGGLGRRARPTKATPGQAETTDGFMEMCNVPLGGARPSGRSGTVTHRGGRGQQLRPDLAYAATPALARNGREGRVRQSARGLEVSARGGGEA